MCSRLLVFAACALMVCFSWVLSGCATTYKDKAVAKVEKEASGKPQIQPANKRSKPSTGTVPTLSTGTSTYWNDPVERFSPYHMYHMPDKPPTRLDFDKLKRMLIEDKGDTRWCNPRLWKWVWREGIIFYSGDWKGAWYLVPSLLPANPPHNPKTTPFASFDGEEWYWEQDHWELGPDDADPDNKSIHYNKQKQ